MSLLIPDTVFFLYFIISLAGCLSFLVILMKNQCGFTYFIYIVFLFMTSLSFVLLLLLFRFGWNYFALHLLTFSRKKLNLIILDLCDFIYLLFYLKLRERARENSSSADWCSVCLQGVRLGQIQEPGTRSRPPTWGAGIQNFFLTPISE